MTSFYEAERARHEREALERDERERARARAEQDAAREKVVADRRAELEERINAASKEASDQTLKGLSLLLRNSRRRRRTSKFS